MSSQTDSANASDLSLLVDSVPKVEPATSSSLATTTADPCSRILDPASTLTPFQQFLRLKEYGIEPDTYPVRQVRPAFVPTNPILLRPSILPNSDTVTFRDSSYFAQHDCLPSPAEVRVAQTNPRTSHPVAFPSLGLMVKYGRAASLAEAQTMWAVRRLLSDYVPVPEVYGWRTDEATGELFVYMELVSGVTLETAWPLLTEPQRLHVCTQLRGMLASLRRLQQDPADKFLGNIRCGPLADCLFIHDVLKPAGPFSDVASFHDHYALKLWQARHGAGYSDEYRAMLHDEAGVAFSHNDLNLSNILVTAPGEDMPRVTGIIDWHQSGWMPDYWESYKMRWTNDEGWAQKYLPLILDDPNEKDDYWYWFEYTRMMGLA